MAKKRKRRDNVIIEKKTSLYRGQTLESLKELDVRETAKFMPSRSRRSVLRKFDIIEKFVKRCEGKAAKSKRIKTHLRDIVIVPKLVGYTIFVHNGKAFQEVQITTEMIGHRLGEFSPSRGIVKHGSAGLGATKGSRAQKK
tara:strand:+ start:1134 stop:1556 length:423 start_codon:yes stop_codon:yes gene_type:complete